MLLCTPFFIMWALEHNENHADNSAEYCEMCGAVLQDGVPDVPNASQASEAISVLAHLYVEDPLATGALLRKIVNPHESHSQIAKAEKCDRTYIGRKLQIIAEKYPTLIDILGFKSKASLSQTKVKTNGPSSEYRGVTWHTQREKWQSQVKLTKKVVYCGLFDQEDDAAKAYNSKAIELLGPKAKLNVIS